MEYLIEAEYKSAFFKAYKTEAGKFVIETNYNNSLMNDFTIRAYSTIENLILETEWHFWVLAGIKSAQLEKAVKEYLTP